jgi:hypothetical protein
VSQNQQISRWRSAVPQGPFGHRFRELIVITFIAPLNYIKLS